MEPRVPPGLCTFGRSPCFPYQMACLMLRSLDLPIEVAKHGGSKSNSTNGADPGRCDSVDQGRQQTTLLASIILGSIEGRVKHCLTIFMIQLLDSLNTKQLSLFNVLRSTIQRQRNAFRTLCIADRVRIQALVERQDAR